MIFGPERLMWASLILGWLGAHAAAAADPTSRTKPPHIISILQDDLGFYDSGVHNPAAAAWTENITSLARNGITLEYHYTHWHCSPSRRSFLSGRLPIHHGEQLSPNSGDDIDLRMHWISDKLSQAGYQAHWFGKYHTGFRSFNHLPIRHNFTKSTGSLQTGGSYSGPKHTTRWQEDHPIWLDSQFTDKPPGCAGDVGAWMHSSSSSSSSCATSAYYNNTNLECGSPITKTDASSAAACCAQCSSTSGCTHWVFVPGGDGGGGSDGTLEPPCHIKRGDANCPKAHAGATSGVVGQSPSPSPPSGDSTCTNEYSTDLWGQLALQAISEHDASTPLYIHLCFQAVHTPYDQAPGDPTGSVYRGMLWRADVFIGQMVTLLMDKNMYNDTLIMYSSDNGGVGDGINYPLRGEKHSNWDGGMRTTAFVSGGFVPAHLRGTKNGANMHLVDWYPTFCHLAGVDPTDDPPLPPLPADPANPFANIYGEHSFPPLDGVNLWPVLTAGSSAAPDAAHPTLVLSKEVILAGRYKLLVSQPYFKTQNNGWKGRDGTWRAPNASESVSCMSQDLPPGESFFPVPTTGRLPCLFNLRADPGEHRDLASENVDLVTKLWAQLNASVGTQRDCSGWAYPKPHVVPGPAQPGGGTSCSPPALLGACNVDCAQAKWRAYGTPDGPMCGVPGCA